MDFLAGQTTIAGLFPTVSLLFIPIHSGYSLVTDEQKLDDGKLLNLLFLAI